MSIEIHCSHCQKLIRAPDEAGGKHGKCPYCKQSVYIPTPPDDGIALAPIDEADERRDEELRRESISYSASVDRDKGSKYDVGDGGGKRRPDAGNTIDAREAIDVTAEVEGYIVAMRDSKLDKADAIVLRLRRSRRRARNHIEALILDQMPPSIGNVPAPLMKGFLKSLLGRLK